MILKLAQLWSIVAFCASFAWAAPDPRVLNHTLESLNSGVSQPLFNSSEMAQIDEWFNSMLPAGEAENRFFYLYLQKRLPLIDEAARAQILSIFENPIFTALDTISGAYSPDFGAILGLPADLENSPYRYSLLIHEGEHAIQYYFMQVDPEALYQNDLLKGGFVKTKFLMEKGAMSAEWQYLHHLPKRVRAELAERIRNHLEIDSEAKANALSIIERSELSLQEYLESQWSRGRYSLTEIMKTSTPTPHHGGCDQMLLGL